MSWTRRRATATARSPATRSRRTSAATRRRRSRSGAVGDERDGHRADQRHELHVQGHRDQRGRARARSRPPRTRSRRRRRSSTSRRPATVDSGDANAGRARRQVQGRLRRHDHRHPLLQGGGEHRHPHRQPVDRRRHAARAGDVHATRPPPAGSTSRFATPVAVTAGTTYVASYFAPNGHYSVTSAGPRPGGRQPAAARARPTATSANGVYAYGAASAFPTNTYNATNYWVDVAVRDRRHAGAGHERHRRRPGSGVGERVLDRAVERRPRDLVPVTPYVGSTAQTPTTVTGSPPATTHDGRRPHRRARPTRSRCRRQRQRRGPGVGAVERGDPDGGRRARGADRRPAAAPASTVGAGELDRAGQRRRQPDHRLHRHAVRRRDRADAGRTSARRRPSATVTGLTNGTAYTFRVAATNAVGHRRRSPTASNAVTPADDDLRLRDAGDRRRGRHAARSSSA